MMPTVLEELKRDSRMSGQGKNSSPGEGLNSLQSWCALAPAGRRTRLTKRSVREMMFGPQFALPQNIAAGDYGPASAV